MRAKQSSNIFTTSGLGPAKPLLPQLQEKNLASRTEFQTQGSKVTETVTRPLESPNVQTNTEQMPNHYAKNIALPSIRDT